MFQASPRPGVTGTLPVANGGTGATTAQYARKNLFGDSMGYTATNFIGITGNWATGGWMTPQAGYSLIKSGITSLNYKGEVNNYNWCKVASIIISGTWNDATLILMYSTVTSNSCALAHIHVSTNATEPATASMIFVVNNGLINSKHAIQKPTTWDQPFIIWAKITGTYGGIRATVLDYSMERTDRGGGDIGWTIYSNVGENITTNIQSAEPPNLVYATSLS